jgi:DNA-binding NarL/FixJ family response regulator
MSAKKNPEPKVDEKAITNNQDQSTQPEESIQKHEKVTIVVADDHAVLRESLAALLGTQPDFEVVGSAKDGAEALELVQAKHPGVLVLDLFMPGSDGFEVLRTLDKAGSRVATVVLTGSESESDYTNVVRLGGRGLVLKSDGPDKLFAAVRAVASGELAFSDDMAQRVLSTMAQDTRSFMQAQASSLDRLSERERQIAFCVARGKKNKDISAQLNISENTVKRHLQSIFNKTGARDRLELAVLALNEASKQAA